MVQWRSLSPVLYNTWNFHRCLCALSRRNKDTLGFCGKVKHWQVSCMHTSAVAASSYAKNTKKKLVRPIRYKTKPMNKDMKAIPVWKNMTVAQLAAKMEKDVDHVFEVLMFVKNGERYEMEDSVLDDEAVIQDIVRKSGFKIVYAKTTSEKVKENKDTVKQSLPDPSKLVKRPPVVTIMGHVDHGKTTLLDALRHSSIVAGEFGGITQHIGAFSVKLPSGEQITFLDTPGHAAFTAMRARGAQLTDIIVLVVAAEDSVMEQTVESIQHAQNAKVPLIVAINKIDKPEADIERTERDLMANNVAVEALGGDVPAVPISALKETNLLELQETITALAEVLELKGDQQGLVEGRVVEARTDLGRGKLATVIVQRGTLKKGCYIVAGTAWAKVRSMFNDMGKPVQEAVPSSPVEIIGWKELPSAGDEIFQVESEQRVKEVVAWRKQQQQEQKMNTEQKIIEKKRQVERMVYEEELEKRRAAGRIKRKPTGPKQKEIVNTYEGPQLSLVLKGDVDGSVEAILDSLESYKSSKCRLDLLHYGVGNVTETDVELAEAFGGVVIGFNVRVPDDVSNLAKKKQVPIRTHKVIYTLFDDIKESLTAQLPVTYQKEIIGEANVIQVFEISDRNKKIPVAGCRCTKGMLSKKEQFQVMRRDLVVFDGSLSSLKHLKNEVETIKTDVECGLSIVDKTVKFECGDIITCYRLKEVQQTIDWELGF